MSYLKYVNIKQGTDSQMRFSNGNTLPLTALPHSHAMFAPQTNSSRGAWYYHPKDRSFEGVRLTHQASPWVNDFSYFCFMPQTERLIADADGRWSGFRPADAELMPHRMKMKLLRYRTEFELAPTTTGCIMRVKVDESAANPVFAFLPFDFDTSVKVDEDMRTITGYTTSYTNAPYRDDFKIYFVFAFDCPISGEMRERTGKKAESVGVYLGSRSYTVRLATSYISEEQARLNLKRETENVSFEQAEKAAADRWEDLLERVRIEADEEMMRTFYSCMYRAYLFPNRFYEMDASGQVIHINPETLEIKEGVYYTNNGFWDTYRTVYPFYSLTIPEKLDEFAEGWLNMYDDRGTLPRWPTPSEFNCMPGTLIEAVFADGIVKGLISEKNVRRALIAMVKNTEFVSHDRLIARKCMKEYDSLGYVPYTKCNESVNETLDSAYGDFCIAVTAHALGDDDTAEKYLKRSKNYRNLFDAKTGFMRGKDENGNFRDEEFDSCMWGRDYTEGSVWQNGFAVPHDYEGLASLYGGKEAFLLKLDELFATEPRYTVDGYGHEIHEMTEMAAANLGQCAISNQPSFHLPFLYAEFGDTQKSHAIVEKIVREYFSFADDGYPGDEDNGTMACWYLFAVLGLYPMCPGKDTFTVIQPIAKTAKLCVASREIDVCARLAGKTKISYAELMEE